MDELQAWTAPSPRTLPSARRRASSRDDGPQKTKRGINRTRSGCRTCRDRKVKCDEKKPHCTQCRKGKRTCEWPGPEGKKARLSRRPNATACHACRDKKLKCTGDVQDTCERCIDLGIECVRMQPGASSSGPEPHQETTEAFSMPEQQPQPSSRPAPPGLGELPTGKELEDLIRLYFSSVHHFGFFSFIHQLHFNRLLAKGKAPRELTLIMIASAMRFAAEATSENLARADAWADAAIGPVLQRLYQGFGAIQLMTLLLAQHYDLNRGNFTSAWLLGANCTRMMQMMSLQTFDRTYPASVVSNPRLSPLLSCEALRRVAWSTFFVDTIVDGGRYGFHIVDEKAYRLQLPCDEASFLNNEVVVTEPLLADPDPHPPGDPPRAPLDMSAYLLRTAAGRRRALHFAFRASHMEQTVEQLSSELDALEADIEKVVTSLPRRYHFNADNVFLYRDRLVTFILLHVLRHNLFIVAGRAALYIHQRDPARADLVAQVRRKRIAHALPIAGLVSEGLKAGICPDPQIGVQAYVALEILLFEPRRLAEVEPLIDPEAPELLEAIPHLLAVIRDIAERSEFVKQLHIEAVHRLLRCGCTHLLNQTDFAAFRSEYRLVGQDAAEYDFRDFRWAKLERIRRGARSSANMERDEALLEYRVGGETAAPSPTPSPRLDAVDVNIALPSRPRPQSAAQSRPSPSDLPSGALDMPEARGVAGVGVGDGAGGLADISQPWWGLTGLDSSDQEFSLDFWDGSGSPGHQAGDFLGAFGVRPLPL